MWELIRANQRRAALLVALMAGLLFLLGYATGEIWIEGGGPLGLLLALAIWIGLTLVAYFQGDRILLAASRARRIEKQDHPVLWNVVEEMCIASGLSKMPSVYILDEEAPNAFATGRNPERAAIAVTAGLLESLDRDELQGVIAHELAHVANRDVLYMTMLGIMMGSIVILAEAGRRALWHGGARRRTSSGAKGGGQAILLLAAVVFVILSPILAQLMYFALSRRREYLADASAALYTRYPDGLASALEKIGAGGKPMPSANPATAPMYIVNPLALATRGLADLTSTHPPLSERIRILRSLGRGSLSLAAYDQAFRRVTGRPVGLVPAGALAAAQSVQARAAAPHASTPAHVERVRQTTDALWRTQGYAFATCTCGTSFKVPPEHAGRDLNCPHCGSPVAVPPSPARAGV